MKKFYKNRKSIANFQGTTNHLEQFKLINNNPNISNHYNYTTINNFNNINESFALNLFKEVSSCENVVNIRNIPTFKENICDIGDNNTITPRKKVSDSQNSISSLPPIKNKDIQYVDMFSKKIIDIRIEQKSKINSTELILSSNNSIDLDVSNKTPSFSGDMLSQMDDADSNSIGCDKKCASVNIKKDYFMQLNPLSSAKNKSVGMLNITEKNSVKLPFVKIEPPIISRSFKR